MVLNNYEAVIDVIGSVEGINAFRTEKYSIAMCYCYHECIVYTVLIDLTVKLRSLVADVCT